MSGELSFDIGVRRGDFELTAAARVAPGEVLGVIGANGSGKSTLVGSIAGTHRVAAGQVSLGDRILTRAGRDPIHVARSKRRTGLLDQRARMFPHLSARANIAFGPSAQGMPRKQAERLAEEWLERVGLSGRGGSRAGELSGGQQQRVAIARTLAAAPELLLLDEPFAALDVTSSIDLRALLAAEVARLKVPVILVTHDPVDLFTIADRAVVIEVGRISQCGPVAEVLGAPATPFAAEFAGRTLLTGIASSRGTLLVSGAPVPELRGQGALPAPGAAGVASFNPAEVRLERLSTADGRSVPDPAPRPTGPRTDPSPEHHLKTAGDDDLRWVGTVSTVSASRTGVRVSCAEWPEFFAEIPVARALELGLSEGEPVELRLPSGSLRFATTNANRTLR